MVRAASLTTSNLRPRSRCQATASPRMLPASSLMSGSDSGTHGASASISSGSSILAPASTMVCAAERCRCTISRI